MRFRWFCGQHFLTFFFFNLLRNMLCFSSWVLLLLQEMDVGMW